MVKRTNSWVMILSAFLGGILLSIGLFQWMLENKLTEWNRNLRVGQSFYQPSVFAGNVVFEPTGDFEKAAQKAVPAIVSVTTQLSHSDSYFGFQELFHSPQKGSGSGVILTPDGYIVTNYHVIEGADDIQVALHDKTEYPAKLIASDPNTDLAVLKIDVQDSLPTLPFGDSDQLRLGQWVLAIGNPFSLHSTVTAGIISGRARNIGILRGQQLGKEDHTIESFIQTDAAVNPGKSGGALVSLAGTLIGINTAIATETGTFAGYSFAIPSNLVKKVVSDLIHYGTVQRAYIGVSIKDIDAADAKELKLKSRHGALVVGLSNSGAAKQSGLTNGDVIISISGKRIHNASELQEIVGNYRPGDFVEVKYLRNNQEKTVNIQLRNQKGTFETVKAAIDINTNESIRRLGASFSELSSEECKKLKIQAGLRVEHLSLNGVFPRAGVPLGFIITQIDKKPIGKAKDAIASLLEDEILYIEGIRKDGRKESFALNTD
ncbi:MAG: trypsin-like peptidase domain-containing protein [Bacteroidia bacterium]|nr:trypsin-like peptidase domain-containing protein [Bacteroidia bacterium]